MPTTREQLLSELSRVKDAETERRLVHGGTRRALIGW